MEYKKKVKILLICFIINLFLILPVSNISILCDNRKENCEQTFNQQNLFLHSSSKPEFFTYYKEITVDHTKVSGPSDLINFPVLISIIDSDLHDYAQPDGDDIAFSNGTFWLDHEIELFNKSYNSTHARLVAWVRIPSLSPSIDTIIKMHYGNSTMQSQESPAGVWNSDYRGVWHLSESTGDIQDSSLNENDGDPLYGVTQDVSGQIDGADEFDGIDDYIDVGNKSTLDISGMNFTISFWIISLEDWDSVSERRAPISKGSAEIQEFAIFKEWNNHKLTIETYDGDWRAASTIKNEWDANTWYYITVTFNQSEIHWYIDGEIDNIISFPYTFRSTTANVWFARFGDEITYRTFEGKLDEVRISNKSCSADWIKTEYNNQYDPSAFYSIGEESTTLGNEYFNYYKEITIDHTKVSGSNDLLNFPVLISIVDPDLHDYAQPDGDDIAFSWKNQWLDHEIELFNPTYSSTHAQLVAWVRIPSLSPSTDTIIKMYYGNSTMTSQENPSGVWNSDYSGVWHLHNDFQDSTNNSNDGTNHGSSDVVGKIGDAQDFAGYDTDQEVTIEANETLNPTYITVSAWIYPRGQESPSNETGMFVSDYSWDYEDSRIWLFYMHKNNRVYAQVYWDEWIPGEDNYTLVCSDIIPLNEWHLAHFTVNSTTLTLYIDGSNAGEFTTASHTGGIVQYINTIEIGSEEQMSGYHEFNGSIDEVRISSSAHSADWISTEYNNQKNPNSFYSIGSYHEVDPTAPQLSGLNESADPLELGSSETIQIDITDLSPIDTVLIETEGTNYTMNYMSGDTYEYTGWIPSSTGIKSYKIYANDTSGNLGFLSDDIMVIDTTPPIYSELTESEDPLELGDTEIITIRIIDLSGINQVLIEINGKANYTMEWIGGNLWRNNSWTPTTKGTHNYTIFIQDNNNNWNTTSGSIEVIESHLPNGGFDFTTLLIIIGITGGTIGAVIGIIILIKKRTRKPKEKELDTIESIID